MAPLTRIDVHHHYFPPSLVAKKTAYDWPTPEGTIKWSPETSIEAMDKLGIQKAILSMPLPIANAHSVNVDASKIVAEHPDRFGFFATLPLGHAPMDVVLEETPIRFGRTQGRRYRNGQLVRSRSRSQIPWSRRLCTTLVRVSQSKGYRFCPWRSDEVW